MNRKKTVSRSSGHVAESSLNTDTVNGQRLDECSVEKGEEVQFEEENLTGSEKGGRESTEVLDSTASQDPQTDMTQCAAEQLDGNNVERTA